MKTTRLAILAIVLSALTSCSDKGGALEKPITGLTDEVYFEQSGDIKSIGLIEHYELVIQKATESNAEGNDLILAVAQEQLAAAKAYVDECINTAGANSEWSDEGADGAGNKNRAIGYKFASIRYKSIDHNGDPIMLSELVIWPYNNILPDPYADNVFIGCHCTITSDFDRPSNYDQQSILTDVGMLAMRASSNMPLDSFENLVIMPDYQGYGASRDKIHPYLSQDLTARQALDGAKAGIAYYKQNHKLEDDWKTISTGYSQGGSVAMAIQRYVEENNLSEEFRFGGSVCGEGPYDPVATLKNYVQTNEVYMPVAVGFMIYSMCNTNPRLMGKYSPEDFLSEKFINSGIIEMIEGKTLTTDQVQEELFKHSAKFNEADKTALCMYRSDDTGKFYPYRMETKYAHVWDTAYGKTSFAKTSDLLLEDAFAFFKDGTLPESKDRQEALKAIEAALMDNVLHLGWKPAHPIFLYHSIHDEVVTLENYTECIKSWEGSDMVKGTRYNGFTKYHVNYGKIFYNIHFDTGLISIIRGKTDKYEFDRIDNSIY